MRMTRPERQITHVSQNLRVSRLKRSNTTVTIHASSPGSLVSAQNSFLGLGILRRLACRPMLLMAVPRDAEGLGGLLRGRDRVASVLQSRRPVHHVLVGVISKAAELLRVGTLEPSQRMLRPCSTDLPWA